MSPRGLVQILNVNANRVNDLVEILQKIMERLPEDAKQIRKQEEEGEW
jgi:RNA binding exosome subunit